MKLTSKAPRAMRLKLKHDEPPSNFDFGFYLRRYTKDSDTAAAGSTGQKAAGSAAVVDGLSAGSEEAAVEDQSSAAAEA
jgi:hypothetical protein